MKRRILYFCLLLGLQWGQNNLQANPISETSAQRAAHTFFVQTAKGSQLGNNLRMTLVHTEKANGSPKAYIFNANEGEGFVIVSGDDDAQPIWGYSTEAGFKPQDIPITFKGWLNNKTEELEYIQTHSLRADAAIQQTWNELLRGTYTSPQRAALAPMVATRWNQSPYYNALCPFNTGESSRTVTGCTATALAQILKFWNYPASGQGTRTYTPSSGDYPSQSAFFALTPYNWAGMPNILQGYNDNIATLMYHCGIAVDMNYNTSAAGGSSAFVVDWGGTRSSAERALKNYFRYASTLRHVLRSDYANDAAWVTMLKSELDNGRPVLHTGYGSGGGHAFVCDGYDNNSLMHFNWGWGGSSDGYFAVNALNPGTLGIGGGTGGFNNSQEALIGVQPETNPAMRVELSAAINPSANPIQYGQNFTVTANIRNRNATPFRGDITAILMDSERKFVAYMNVISENNGLANNATYPAALTFSSANITRPLFTGNYYIGIYTRTNVTQNNWLEADGGNFQNVIPVRIENNAPLKLNTAITSTPVFLATNSPASFNFDLINSSSNAFSGGVKIRAYSENGTFIRDIATYSNLNLCSNCVVGANGLTLSTPNLGLNAGKYILAIFHEQSPNNWILTSNTSSTQNPIAITVNELQPDMYEANGDESNAYIFFQTYTNNQTNCAITNANFHQTDDEDYYRLLLPSGYNYTINTRLRDAFGTDNGQNYTAFVDWRYKLGTAGTWSAYNSNRTQTIQTPGGQPLILHIHSSNAGKGIYEFVLDISRSLPNAVGVENTETTELLQIFPNPARASFQIKLAENEVSQVENISILNAIGQQISQFVPTSAQTEIQTADWANGIYFVQVITNKGKFVQKIQVQK